MRVFNFSAGPATMPEEVLRRAAAEMLDWQGSGVSVVEMSHRGAEFTSIHDEALADLRDLMHVPGSYRILFLQGGGIGANGIVPMNLLRDKQTADFVVHRGTEVLHGACCREREDGPGLHARAAAQRVASLE
jgi:phosphoserine aminotransferase